MWQYDEPENGILQVRIDRDGRPVNSFSIETMNSLRDVATFVAGRDDITTVIFSSGKRGNFIAGADLYEIRENATYDATLKMSRNGHSAFQAIEELQATTIAVIHGVALGGGLEFAMACDYRIAADDTRTLLGLPEVFLGLMPGWGATVRAPRLVGYERAIDMLLGGGNLQPAEALEAGLVDAVVPVDDLEKTALQFAKKPPEVNRDRKVNPDVVRAHLLEAENRQTAAAGSNYPAPLKMIEVLRNGLDKDEEQKYELEADGISTLAPLPSTKQLIRLFFLKEASKKPPADIKEAAKAFELKSVGIIADNDYGESIASLFFNAGVKTELAQLGEPNTGAALPSHEKLKRTGDVQDLGDVSVIIEAIVDDLEAEQGLFMSLGTIVHPDAPIASTSASFLLKEQGEGLVAAERLIGLRFFSPVEQTSLIEIVRQPETAFEALGAAYSISRRLGRNPVVVNDSPGFLVNRLLLPYLTEAGYLLTELDDPTEITRATNEFGMTPSPFELLDTIGLRVITAIKERLHKNLKVHLPASPLWMAIRDSADPNMRFLDDNGELNTEVLAIRDHLREASPNQPAAPKSIINRLVFPMINAGACCLAEGVVSSEDEIDLAMMLAGSFPTFRGGPMQYGRAGGLQTVVDALTEMSEGRPRLEPSESLRNLA